MGIMEKNMESIVMGYTGILCFLQISIQQLINAPCPKLATMENTFPHILLRDLQERNNNSPMHLSINHHVLIPLALSTKPSQNLEKPETPNPRTLNTKTLMTR